MKRLLRAVMLLSVVGGNCVFANSSEFRSPRRLTRGVMHYPLANIENAWWYDEMPKQADECRSWQLETWAAGWRMVADAAFDARESGSTTKTTSLSQLWFGDDVFRGEQIFAGGIINDPQLLMQTNPFLGFARIKPSFDYNEHGVMFGLYFRQDFGEDGCWHVGFRASLPVIEIEIDNGCLEQETLADVAQRVPINLDANGAPNQIDYAYRLDLLSSLARPADIPSDLVPLVQYGNGDGSTLHATWIGGQPGIIADTNAQGSTPTTGMAVPAAYVIRADGTNLINTLESACGGCDTNRHNCSTGCGVNSSLENDGFVTGQIPTYPFRKLASQVTGQVAADGSGGTDGSVLFFQITGQNYAANLALDRDAQSELFVVPRVDPLATPPDIYQSSVAIDQAVQSVLQFIDPAETATDFFLSRGIDFCPSDSVVGVGDLFTEISIGAGNYKDWYSDFLFGVLFPTGTPEGPANHIYHKPTGNNRHVELKVGIEGGWQPLDWFAFRGFFTYHHAFKRKECRALPFDQTSLIIRPSNINCPCTEQFFVKNIGQGREFNVSWNYFVFQFDLTFFHPYNPDLGWTFGYELFAKGRDNVSYVCDNNCDCFVVTSATSSSSSSCCSASTTPVNVATDLLGRTNQPLNLEVLEQNTNSLTNKLYAEMFHRWNFFELFGGASQIVSGRHAMQETEAHIGMKVFF